MTQDSQDQTLVLAFRNNSLKPFKLVPFARKWSRVPCCLQWYALKNRVAALAKSRDPPPRGKPWGYATSGHQVIVCLNKVVGLQVGA